MLTASWAVLWWIFNWPQRGARSGASQEVTDPFDKALLLDSGRQVLLPLTRDSAEETYQQ